MSTLDGSDTENLCLYVISTLQLGTAPLAYDQGIEHRF